MTADEKEQRDLKRAMMSDDFPEGPDGDLESRKIFVGELLTLSNFHVTYMQMGWEVNDVIPRVEYVNNLLRV